MSTPFPSGSAAAQITEVRLLNRLLVLCGLRPVNQLPTDGESDANMALFLLRDTLDRLVCEGWYCFNKADNVRVEIDDSGVPVMPNNNHVGMFGSYISIATSREWRAWNRSAPDITLFLGGPGNTATMSYWKDGVVTEDFTGFSEVWVDVIYARNTADLPQPLLDYGVHLAYEQLAPLVGTGVNATLVENAKSKAEAYERENTPRFNVFDQNTVYGTWKAGR